MAYVLRSIVAVGTVLAVAAGLGAAYYYMLGQPNGGGGSQARGGPPAGFAMPVEAAPVKTGPSQRQVLAIGTLRSNESVIIRPEVAGRIVGIRFNEGAKVKKDEVLIRLDDAIQKAELVQAESSLALARANYERANELLKRGAGTERALDEARAKLRNDEASVALARARLEKLTIVAPFDGVVGLRKVSVGDYVNVGAEIANLEAIDPLKVDFRVPEIFLSSIRPGQKIDVRVDALPDRAFTGEVYAIDPLIDAAGRSIVIRALIANPDDVLRPGLFARVVVTLEARANALWVPEESIVPVGDQHFLFKVVDGKAVYTRVRLGERKRGDVEIVEGLNPGDVVVTAGLLKIRDGMPIAVLPAGGPRGPDAPTQTAPGKAPAASEPKSGAPSVAEGNRAG
ncbi:MAG TPA: efflux RND transporter periplasmic adaptor subunit [Alphaproteobacteria bacterium]|nr:efflux RND transporter periplasmic adaptor subunit [Alphaproteobacteria bacterium]